MKRRDPRGSPARERRPTRTAPATPNGCLLGHKRRSAATSLPCLEPLPEQPPRPSRANPTTVAIAVGKQACEFASSMLKLCMDGLKMLINLVPQWGGAWKKWSWQSGMGEGGMAGVGGGHGAWRMYGFLIRKLPALSQNHQPCAAIKYSFVQYVYIRGFEFDIVNRKARPMDQGQITVNKKHGYVYQHHRTCTALRRERFIKCFKIKK